MIPAWAAAAGMAITWFVAHEAGRRHPIPDHLDTPPTQGR